jgi:hypothetical protein
MVFVLAFTSLVDASPVDGVTRLAVLRHWWWGRAETSRQFKPTRSGSRFDIANQVTGVTQIMRTKNVFRSTTCVGLVALLVGCLGCSSLQRSKLWLPTSARDCSRDVTNILNAALARVPNNSNLALPANGCYRINGTITIRNKKNVTIDAHNSRFMAMTNGREFEDRVTRTRSQFRVIESTNITIKNAIVYGNNRYAGLNDLAYVPELEAQHAFDIQSGTNVTLDHVQAYKVYGDFVYIGGTTRPSRNVVVKNSTFRGNGRIGITVANAADVNIHHNVLDDMRRSIFDLEPYAGNWLIQRVTIRSNIIGEGRLNFLSAFGACAVVEGISVLDNLLVGQELQVEVINNTGCNIRRKNFVFKNNVSDKMFGTPSGMALKFIGVDGIVATGNIVPLQPNRDMHLVRLTNSSGAWIAGNDLPGADGSIFTNDGSRNYCHSDNRIGDPLRAEATNKPCG